MNSYGTRAMAYWRDHRPLAMGQIEDPTEFFSTLGRQIQAQVDELRTQMEGRDTPGEGYLDKVGRLNAARALAEEMVMAELVYSQPPEAEEDDGDEVDPIGQAMAAAHLADLAERERQEAQQYDPFYYRKPER